MKLASKAWENDETNFINDLLLTAKHVPKIENYLLEEVNYLKNNIVNGSSVIDFGCGNGRHLNILKNQISKGLGIDMNRSYLKEASCLCDSNKIRFEVGDIQNYHGTEKFDIAIAMYNTFGNIENQQGMIDSMIRSVKRGGKIIISVFSTASVPFRLEMYKKQNFKNLEVEEYRIITEEGFRSECFTESRIKEFMPEVRIEKCTDIGWIVVWENN